MSTRTIVTEEFDDKGKLVKRTTTTINDSGWTYPIQQEPYKYPTTPPYQLPQVWC